ncbi:MAG TPA: hypothetical protein PLC07_05625 [Bacillota bacterium]|nr:hypothetical protein [Bacillota bacterium]
MENNPDAGTFSRKHCNRSTDSLSRKIFDGISFPPQSKDLLQLPEIALGFHPISFIELYYNYTKVPFSLLFLKNFLKNIHHFLAGTKYWGIDDF